MPPWLQAVSDFIETPAYADAASISPKGMAYVESRGASPEVLRTPGPKGELGRYQITPKAWAELARVLPQYRKKDRFNTLVNDSTAEQAMKDYFSIIEKQAKYYNLPIDDPALLQMYNLGIGNYKSGERNQAYVDTYNRGL